MNVFEYLTKVNLCIAAALILLAIIINKIENINK